MDPFSMIGAATSLIGLGMSFGASQKYAEAAHQKYLTEGMEATTEMHMNDLRHQQMVLTANRQQMQNVRNMQLARSMAISSATNQGAQFGTGLQGGLGQISGQSGNQVLGLNQDVTLGDKMFSDLRQINAWKQGEALLGSQMADDQGQMQMGSAISSAGPTIGKLFGGLPGLFGGGGGANMFGGMG